MCNLSAINFLQSPSTRLANVYGHLISIYELKHKLIQDQLIPFVFVDFSSRTSLSFRMNYETKEVTELMFTNIRNHNTDPFINTMAVEDAALMSKVFAIYLSRLEKLVADKTESLSEFLKSDPIELEFKFECMAGYEYCHYFLKLTRFIEDNYRLDIFNYTMKTLNQKVLMPFNVKRTLAFY